MAMPLRIARELNSPSLIWKMNDDLPSQWSYFTNKNLCFQNIYCGDQHTLVSGGQRNLIIHNFLWAPPCHSHGARHRGPGSDENEGCMGGLWASRRNDLAQTCHRPWECVAIGQEYMMNKKWTSQAEKEPSLRGQMERARGGYVQASMLIASSTVRKHRPQILGSASRVLLLLFTPDTQPVFLQHNLHAKEAGLGGVSSYSLLVSRPRWWVTKKSSLVFLFDNLDSYANLPLPFQHIRTYLDGQHRSSHNSSYYTLSPWGIGVFATLDIYI